MPFETVAQFSPRTAIGGRLFRREEGRTICYERYGTTALRAKLDCGHGVSAAHPAGECERY